MTKEEINRLRSAASDVVRHDMFQDKREGVPTSMEVLHLKDILDELGEAENGY